MLHLACTALISLQESFYSVTTAVGWGGVGWGGVGWGGVRGFGWGCIGVGRLCD